MAKESKTLKREITLKGNFFSLGGFENLTTGNIKGDDKELYRGFLKLTETSKKKLSDLASVIEKEFDINKKWRPSWMDGDCDILSVKTKFPIKIFELDSDDYEMSDDKIVTNDSVVKISFVVKITDGIVATYPSCMMVIEQADEKNPFTDDDE